jgi:two-component system OmpR family sensor kinase
LLTQQRRFIADAAHELRSPLTALLLQAQNIQRSDSLEDLQSRVEPLQAGIERARQLTEQLLTLARTQADSSPDEDVDVAALARNVMAEYLPLAEAKHIDMGLEEIAKLSLTGSRLSLRLLLKNALENALKYTPEGGVVTLRLRSEMNSAVIEIVDNGPGIPAAERDRVFDAFYRMPDSVGEGNGLGLAIAREAALRLGGTVGLYGAEHGTGTIFRYQCMNRI